MNIEQIKKAINQGYFSHSYIWISIEIDKVKLFVKKTRPFLIEDAAEMLGHNYKKHKCGFYGDISTFGLCQ